MCVFLCIISCALCSCSTLSCCSLRSALWEENLNQNIQGLSFLCQNTGAKKRENLLLLVLSDHQTSDRLEPHAFHWLCPFIDPPLDFIFFYFFTAFLQISLHTANLLFILVFRYKEKVHARKTCARSDTVITINKGNGGERDTSACLLFLFLSVHGLNGFLAPSQRRKKKKTAFIIL